MKLSLCDVRKEELSLVGFHDSKFSYFLSLILWRKIFMHMYSIVFVLKRKTNPRENNNDIIIKSVYIGESKKKQLNFHMLSVLGPSF